MSEALAGEGGEDEVMRSVTSAVSRCVAGIICHTSLTVGPA